jgi:hypothetical protein
MKTTDYVEICISIDDQTNAERVFMQNEKDGEREQGNGETERDRVCVCEC